MPLKKLPIYKSADANPGGNNDQTLPETFHTGSQYYNLPTPAYTYVRFSFPLNKYMAMTWWKYFIHKRG